MWRSAPSTCTSGACARRWSLAGSMRWCRQYAAQDTVSPPQPDCPAAGGFELLSRWAVTLAVADITDVQPVEYTAPHARTRVLRLDQDPRPIAADPRCCAGDRPARRAAVAGAHPGRAGCRRLALLETAQCAAAPHRTSAPGAAAGRRHLERTRPPAASWPKRNAQPQAPAR